MLKRFGIISLTGIVVAIAAAGSYATRASFVQVGVLVVSGVLAHAFVTSAERDEESRDDSEGEVPNAARIMGNALRVALGAVVLAITTVSALYIAGA
jgi:hypothetical protein